MKKVLSSSINNPPTSMAREGFILLEPILAIGLLALFAIFLLPALFFGRDTAVYADLQNKSLLLAEEGIEAVRSIRDLNFEEIEDGAYYLDASEGSWQLEPGNEVIDDIHNRTIVISTPEPDVRMISSEVTWTYEQRHNLVSLETYITNWKRPTQ